METRQQIVDFTFDTLRAMNLSDTATQAILQVTMSLLDVSKLPRIQASLRELRQSITITNTPSMLSHANHGSAALHNVMQAFAALHTTRQR